MAYEKESNIIRRIIAPKPGDYVSLAEIRAIAELSKKYIEHHQRMHMLYPAEELGKSNRIH